MTNYNQIACMVCTNIYRALAERIRGHIVVYEKDNVIKVEIENDGFTFNYDIQDANHIFLWGYDVNAFVLLIEKSYKHALMKKYFREV